MMKHHRSSRARMLAGAAAILAVAGMSLALGSPGFAQAEAQTQEKAQPGTERREERTIIRTFHHDADDAEHREHRAHGEGSADRQRVIVMSHRGDGGHHGGPDVRVHGANGEVVIPDCDGGQSDEINEGAENNRTRIILCSQGQASPAQRAERLQRARDRLANDSELSAEQKARVTAALDRQIARLRGE